MKNKIYQHAGVFDGVFDEDAANKFIEEDRRQRDANPQQTRPLTTYEKKREEVEKLIKNIK
jgi:hypothetical protein